MPSASLVALFWNLWSSSIWTSGKPPRSELRLSNQGKIKEATTGLREAFGRNFIIWDISPNPKFITLPMLNLHKLLAKSSHLCPGLIYSRSKSAFHNSISILMSEPNNYRQVPRWYIIIWVRHNENERTESYNLDLDLDWFNSEALFNTGKNLLLRSELNTDWFNAIQDIAESNYFTTNPQEFFN